MASRASVDRPRARLPPIKTALNATPSRDGGTPTSPRPHTPGQGPHQQADESESRSPSGPQRFVVADPLAFRYLEEDPSTTVLDRRREMRGYECYIVEQWTTSRAHPTFMIVSYTGDPSQVIIVGVLGVPADENQWSPRLRVYFKALNQFHARRQDTPLGILMVTKLSGFPSSLTVIPVPDGDPRKHRFDFFVNENLKRLGCSGRVGLSLQPPTAATIAKFHQIYRTSDKLDIYKAVLELVKLCQNALALFSKLEIEYADGLLCDITERAVDDWWVEIGYEQYNVVRHDGMLGPTTVAGLLGLLMGARNRLHAVNAPVTKDPFDVEGMKRGISAFQKQQRLPRTRRLDRRTLDRLHKATQKAADKERWAVPKAVKSTVAELSGKGGEMVMEAVGRRDKAGIAEIETVDIDRFVQLVYGDRAKWLWLGKSIKKSKTNDGPEGGQGEVQEEPRANKGLVFKSDEHGGYSWAASRKGIPNAHNESKGDQEEEYEDYQKAATLEEEQESETENKFSVFKRAGTIRDEAKSGLSKIGGAVGFHGHRHKPSVDDPAPTSPVDHESKRRPLLRRALSSPASSSSSPKAEPREARPMPAVAEQSDRLNAVISRNRADTAESTRSTAMTAQASKDSLPLSSEPRQKQQDEDTSAAAHRDGAEVNGEATLKIKKDNESITGPMYNGVDLNETLPCGPETEVDVSKLLRRTNSDSHFITLEVESHDEGRIPRHLSFSLAEDSVLNWSSVAEDTSDPFHDDAKAHLAIEELLAKEAKSLQRLITLLQSETATWTTAQIERLHAVLAQCDQDQESLDAMHYPHLQSVRELQSHSQGVLRGEKDRLEEGAKEIETIAAKLEYEVSGLKGKIEDVKVGVSDFEKGVARVEERVQELEREGERQGSRCVVQ